MSTLLFEVTIPGRVRIKKNGRRYIGNGKNIPSKQFSLWEKESSIFVLKAFHKFRQNLPIKEACRAEFEFYFKNHQHECDTSNCIEGPQDLLQKMRIIENDSLITDLSAKKIFIGPDQSIIRLFSL